jgi:hypothetical protein
MEGASPPERSVAKTTKLSCKFQAVILNRLEANWRALVRPYLTPIHGAETPEKEKDMQCAVPVTAKTLD